MTLSIAATDTANLAVGDGHYDLEIVNSAGNVYRILEGTFSVRGNTSR